MAEIAIYGDTVLANSATATLSPVYL